MAKKNEITVKDVTIKTMNINAVLINDGEPQGERLIKLNQIAIQQMQVLENSEGSKLLK